jgi:hypothetical protein
MLHLSRFRPDPATLSTFVACLWQGDVPQSLDLRTYLYTSTDPLEMALLWEGDAEAASYMDRAFATFGTWTDESVTDQTPAMHAALARDLDAFGDWMRRRGDDDDWIARQLDLRRRGRDAATPEDARAEAAAHDAEQPPA